MNTFMRSGLFRMAQSRAPGIPSFGEDTGADYLSLRPDGRIMKSVARPGPTAGTADVVGNAGSAPRLTCPDRSARGGLRGIHPILDPALRPTIKSERMPNTWDAFRRL